jgi:choline-sulfatase
MTQRGNWTRRRFLATAAGAAVTPFIATHASAQSRPNILFIYTDDQGPWALGASGNEQAHTPNMDRLAAEGAYLTNSFVTTPVCSPSRCGLLCSRYGSELGITDWINPTLEPEIGLDQSAATWVRDLERAGYATALVGKWHLGIQDRHHPSHFGYQHFAGFRPGGNKVENPELEIDGELQTVEGLTTDLLTDYALEYLDQFADEQPFCLSVHYRAPHAPWKPVRDEDNAPFDGVDMKLPEPDFPDLDVERAKRAMREYLASVASVDRNVGRLIDALDKLGLADNTIVVFTSDHGYNVGHHGLLHKGNGSRLTNEFAGKNSRDPGVTRPNMFDTSLRVPTLIRWPGEIEPATTFTPIFSNLDWYPTLLAMVGVEPDSNATIRGRNYLPIIRGARIRWDQRLYGEYSIHHYYEADLRMMRIPEWKLIRDFKNPDNDELYNLADDPGEKNNRIADTSPEVVGMKESLDRMIRDRMEQIGDLVLG